MHGIMISKLERLIERWSHLRPNSSGNALLNYGKFKEKDTSYAEAVCTDEESLQPDQEICRILTVTRRMTPGLIST